MTRSSPAVSRAPLLLAALIGANLFSWTWALLVFGHNSALIAASLLAWSYGLRHAVDADHIAAIDTVTRQLMQQGQRPTGVGAFFSLGHSTIVILATFAIALTASAFQAHMGWLHTYGGMIGSAVSSGFLLLMALSNLLIPKGIWRRFRRLKQGNGVAPEEPLGGGLMYRLFGALIRLTRKSWHMYLVGFLFGLGFDTATEVGLLGLSAAGASAGIAIWSIMIFPALFASGMALVDTLDNLMMINAYGWALNKPQRRLYYNMTVTATSVLVALFIGGLEAAGLLAEKFDLQGAPWRLVASLNDQLGNAGFVVIGLFAVCWGISVLNYRWRRYDKLPV